MKYDKKSPVYCPSCKGIFIVHEDGKDLYCVDIQMRPPKDMRAVIIDFNCTICDHRWAVRYLPETVYETTLPFEPEGEWMEVV